MWLEYDQWGCRKQVNSKDLKGGEGGDGVKYWVHLHNQERIMGATRYYRRSIMRSWHNQLYLVSHGVCAFVALENTVTIKMTWCRTPIFSCTVTVKWKSHQRRTDCVQANKQAMQCVRAPAPPLKLLTWSQLFIYPLYIVYYGGTQCMSILLHVPNTGI